MFYRTEEESITAQLEQLETAGGRQLGVATVASLEGHDVGDYGYRLGRAWGIGGKEANDGVVFLIAPNDRRMNISVGYGLEPILNDALSGRIIPDVVTPATAVRRVGEERVRKGSSRGVSDL